MWAVLTASSTLLSYIAFFRRVARIHRSVVRSKAKLSLHLSQQTLQTPECSVSYSFLLSFSMCEVTLRSQRSSTGKHKRGEVSMFHVKDTFSVFSDLRLFTLLEQLGGGFIHIAFGIRWYHLNIKERLSHITPKPTALNIASCFALFVRRLVVKRFSTEWL